jgi:serine/threonine-protein kinase
VIVKRIADVFSASAEQVQMFLDEARIAAQLRHPHLVQVFELGEHGGAYYLTMEYLHGEDLYAVIARSIELGRPLPPTFGARVVAAAAEGLASAHDLVGIDGKPLQIVHRDVSPQNIFVTYDGAVKVLDFGVAFATNRRQAPTQAGHVKGKYGYMSPEQMSGSKVDRRTDVWALGVVLFEACTQQRLFASAGGPIAAMQKIMTGPIPRASERVPTIPEELDHIMMGALTREAVLRTQDARTLQRQLEDWLKTQPDAPSSSDLAATMRELFRERMVQKQALLESVMADQPKASDSLASPPPLKTRSERPPTPAAGAASRQRPWLVPVVAAPVLLLLVLGILLTRLLRHDAQTELTITSEIAGGQVFVDERAVGRTPITLKDLSPGQHTVALETAEGRTEPRAITVEAGRGVVLQLAQPVAPPKPPAPAAPSPVPAAPTTTSPEPALTPTVTRPHPDPPRPSAKGQLSLDTIPWTSVYLHGRRLGQTPLIEYVLPVGHHELKLVNEEKGLTRVIEVDIAAGETTALRLTL